MGKSTTRFIAALLTFCTALANAAEPQRVNFSRDVLPILSNTCFACHGPDPSNRKADVRTNTPLHALVTLNDVTYVEAARGLAQSVLLQFPVLRHSLIIWSLIVVFRSAKGAHLSRSERRQYGTTRILSFDKALAKDVRRLCRPTGAIAYKNASADGRRTPLAQVHMTHDSRAAFLIRRQFFGRNAVGLGSAALATLLGRGLPAADAKKQVGGLPGLPHRVPKAKHVIYLLPAISCVE